MNPRNQATAMKASHMPVPKYDEMFYPVPRALSDGKAWTSRQVQDAMADHFHLSDEDKADRIKSSMAR